VQLKLQKKQASLRLARESSDIGLGLTIRPDPEARLTRSAQDIICGVMSHHPAAGRGEGYDRARQAIESRLRKA